MASGAITVTGAEAFRKILRPPIVTRSLWVAVIVGTILNVINQGDVILAGDVPNWSKLTLTYVVPFLVASFGSWSALKD